MVDKKKLSDKRIFLAIIPIIIGFLIIFNVIKTDMEEFFRVSWGFVSLGTGLILLDKDF